MSEPAQKWENSCGIFKQNYTHKLFISFKISYSCCFGISRGNLEFPDFLQKKSFITSTSGEIVLEEFIDFATI